MQDMLLYDIQDLIPTNFILKEKKTQPKLAGNESYTNKTVPSFDNSVTQKEKKSSKKMKLSITPSLESQYQTAVKNNDMEAAQKVVDKVAKEAGYTVKAYHGTPIKNITSFDISKIGNNTDSGIFGHGFYYMISLIFTRKK